MSRDKVEKFFEVRLFSLAIVAVTLFFLFIFLIFFFAWREQYVYAAAMAALAVIMLLAALKLSQYAKMFRKHTTRQEHYFNKS